MRIDKIRVSNFKCFSDINVNFDEGVNLFVGGNGSGKTAVLDAINVALGGFFGSQEQKLQRMIEFDEIKITNGIREPTATVLAISRNIEGEWSRTIKRDTKTNDTKATKPASDYGEAFFKNFNSSDDRTITPVIAYYSTQRLFKDASLSGKQRYDAANGRRNGYLQCLKDNAIKGVLNEWLGNAVTRRATLQIKEIENNDLILANVETAIRETLILFLELPEDFSLKIYQDPDFDNELFVHYDETHNLPISYYSDGFRNILYLIIDLVWRASQLNPWLSLNEIGDSVNGAVTIDEIDLHLHPKWQAKVVGLMQRLFPSIQFFITTHSPTVVANFQNGSLYVIDNSIIEKNESPFFGKQINHVLRNVLGAADRHAPTQDSLNKLFRLIDENQSEQYEPLLNDLEQLLGSDDADINKAKSLIEWQKSLAS